MKIKQSKYIRETLAVYHEQTLGLPYSVELRDCAIQLRDRETNEITGVSVPGLETLVATIAVVRAYMANKLLPPEIRFMRKAIDYKSKDMAKALGVTSSAYSRWENADCAPLEERTERHLRHIVIARLSSKAPSIQVDSRTIDQMGLKQAFGEGRKPKMVFRTMKVRQGAEVHDEWAEAA
jgi:DNA-binding XRE family transcriptional regulator